MSENNKYLGGESLVEEVKLPETKDIYADMSWARGYTGNDQLCLANGRIAPEVTIHGRTLGYTDYLTAKTNQLANCAYAIAQPAYSTGIVGTGHSVFAGDLHEHSNYGTVGTSAYVNSALAIAQPAYTTGMVGTGHSVFAGGLREHSGYGTAVTSAYVNGISANVQSSLLASGSSAYRDYLTGSTSVFAGSRGFTDHLSVGAVTGISALTVNAQSSLVNAGTSVYNNSYQNGIGRHGGYLTTLNSVFANSDINEDIQITSKASSLYGAVLDTASFYKLDTHIKPTSIHSYIDGTQCLRMFDDLESSMHYGGYSDHILKRTKELFALNDQLSLLNAESAWLDSKINDEFYQSLYLPHGQDLASYLENWSVQVKLKIQKVEAKVDRLFRYIVKLKIKAGTRRINKKRVFRTKVNLVFKNLDDAHPANLNYSDLANALFKIFNYKTSWRLTFNN